MDVVFTCSADIFCGYIAVLVLGFSTQDVFQVHLGSVQLGFGRGFVRSGQWGGAQCGVGQSADNTFFTVNHDRFAAVRCVFADGHFLGQAEVDRFACTACGNDVLVFACVGNGIAQVHFFRRPVVRNNVQTFSHFFAYFVQCVLNGAYGRMFRAVRFGNGKARRCNLSGCRINVGVQRFGYWVQLADVHSVSIRRTFGYAGNFVAAVVQTVFGQGYGRACRTVGNVQTVGRQYAVARGHFRRNQSCIRQRAVACFQGSRSYTIQRNIVIQLDGNIVVVCRSGNVVAAFNADSLTQFFA